MLITKMLQAAQATSIVEETLIVKTIIDTVPMRSAISPPSIKEAPTTEFVDATDSQDQSFIDVDSMPPPTRRSFLPTLEDKSEEVPHTCSRFDLDIFQMALGLWYQDASITRQQYSSLLEMLALLQDPAQVKTLPKSIKTLRRKTHSRLPFMKVQKQRIPLIAAKLPTAGRAFSSTPMDWLYWFDPSYLISTLLASEQFKAKMHFGMAEYVDLPKELWHSPSWGTSIRSCSGDFAYCGPRSENQPIFPFDIVHYRCGQPACTALYLGRVYTVRRDHSKFAVRAGNVTLQIQALQRINELDQSWQPIFEDLKFPLQTKELVCVKDKFHYVLEDHIASIKPNVSLDYVFDDLNPIDCWIGQYDTFIIRRIFSKSKMLLRLLNLSPPIRAELEIAEFSRQYMINTLTDSLSVPLLCFMDAFGLYQNMYRSLLGIYFIFAGLTVKERKQRSNVFPLTFGPHGSKLKDICDAIKPGIAALDRGTSIIVNGEKRVVCTFIMAWLGDMPQQQDNSGFKRQNAIQGCRYCIIYSEARDELDFDVVRNGRYHSATLALREKERTMNKREWKAFCVKWGLSEAQSPVVSLTPALDVIRTRSSDPEHSKYAGISKLAHDLLMNAILSADGQRRYTSMLQSFPFPPGWGRL